MSEKIGFEALELPRKIILEGRELLATIARVFGSRKLHDKDLILILEAMIIATPFEQATILAYKGDSDMAQKSYENMYTHVGIPASEHAYNIWFTYDEMTRKWQLRYSKISKNENYHSV